MFKCGLMVMVVTGLIVCPHHNITLVYTTITAHHVITHRALTISTSTLSQWALICYWDHLKNFIAEIPPGPLGMSIGTIWVTQKRSQGPPARGF